MIVTIAARFVIRMTKMEYTDTNDYLSNSNDYCIHCDALLLSDKEKEAYTCNACIKKHVITKKNKAKFEECYFCHKGFVPKGAEDIFCSQCREEY